VIRSAAGGGCAPDIRGGIRNGLAGALNAGRATGPSGKGGGRGRYPAALVTIVRIGSALVRRPADSREAPAGKSPSVLAPVACGVLT
jgi:hypothetical protein